MTTVIFACVHNAGRSQIAAAFFNQLVEPTKARAISAGTQPVDLVHLRVRMAMSEAGVDLTGAKPKKLTAAYQVEDGTYVDVVSLINSDKFVTDKMFLINVADEALKLLRKKYEANKRPIEGGLSAKIAHQLEAR